MPNGWTGLLAIGFLILSVACCIALVIFQLRRPGRYSVKERLIYAPAYTLARILWRVEIHWDSRWSSVATRNVSVDEYEMLRDRMASGAVLIANHRSSVDPFFIQLAAGCRVHWMVAGEYFRHFAFGPLLRSYQAIPTNRGGMDNAATKKAIRLASDGGFVGMFPEGRINRTECALLSIRPGAALVASRARVPLIPIWIEGAPVGPEVYSPLFMPAHVRVRIGVPCQQNQTLNSIEGEFLLEGTNVETNDVIKLDREQSKEWISNAMCELLRLGEKQDTEVQMAGKQWAKS